MEKEVQSIIIKKEALDNLKAEYDYYAYNYSTEYAEKFRLDFFKKVRTILPNPFVYPECRFLVTKNNVYRNIIWNNYLIIYKVKRKSIDILLLFHTKQHPKKLKKGRRVK